jgi:hypothetical protein
MSPLRLYAVVLNVPATVTLSVKAASDNEACTTAIDRFRANPRLFKRQELGQPAILSCDALSTGENPA